MGKTDRAEVRAKLLRDIVSLEEKLLKKRQQLVLVTRTRGKSEAELLMDYFHEKREETLVRVGFDSKLYPDGPYEPVFVNIALGKLIKAAGGDLETYTAVVDEYFMQTRPGNSKPPYTFRWFADDEEWGRLLREVIGG
jgi:hypothetical protein